jgi:endonuclease/exonuclease/phosphatase family metal-dependent hydrolase
MSLLKPVSYLLVSLLISSCTTAGINTHKIAEVDTFPADKAVSKDYELSNDGTLRLLTLNIAHGRNQAANQLLLEKEDIEQNISSIARLLKKTSADVVALQEADGPSGWSGKFDHIELLAREAGYPWYYRANHAESWLFSYGTAILSRLPVSETLQHTFKPSPPTFNKGFLLGQVNWMNHNTAGSALAVDVVSVHLDFSRQQVRDEQIAEMAEVFANRENPMIILGDFNSEWLAEKSVVKKLAEKAGMSVYDPGATDLHTYNSSRRYDWILISDELAFARYEVLPDVLSDHLAVLAEIKLKNTTEKSAEKNR